MNSVNSDPVDPSGKGISGFETAQKPKNPDEDLLGHVFSVFRGHTQKAEYAQDSRLVTSEQGLESPLIPVENLGDELLVLAVISIGGGALIGVIRGG